MVNHEADTRAGERWTLDNIYTLARRELRRLERLAYTDEERDGWRHVIRLCEKAGCQGRGVLRDALGAVSSSPSTPDVTLSREQWDAALHEADTRMKRTNGHAYLTILKTRCQRCGRSPKQKGNCPRWFEQMLDKLYEVLTGGVYERIEDTSKTCERVDPDEVKRALGAEEVDLAIATAVGDGASPDAVEAIAAAREAVKSLSGEATPSAATPLEDLERELTCARLVVNDFYNCRTNEELDKWRAAQKRLIEAAKAVGRSKADPVSPSLPKCVLCGAEAGHMGLSSCDQSADGEHRIPVSPSLDQEKRDRGAERT